MRLTKGQIEHVRRRVTDAPFPDGVYEHALAALDAYERVAALLEYDCLIGPDQLRRALYGDA